MRLLRSLWRILRSYTREQVVRAAWRCLSKLGGENRRLLRDPEMVEESIVTTELPQVVFFGPYDPTEGSSAPRFRISLPKIVENCCSLLSRQHLDITIKRHAVATLHVYVRLSFGLSMEWTGNQQEDNSGQTGSMPANAAMDSDSHKTFNYADSNNWLTAALVGLFSAAGDQDELSEKVAQFLKALMKQCTLETLQGGSETNKRSANLELILKAVFRVLKTKSDHVYPVALSCLKSYFEIAYESLGDWEKVLETPFACYVTETAMTLCLSNRPEAKVGSCFALNSLLETLPTDWALKNLERIFSCIISVQNEIDVETCGIAKRHATVTLENLMNKIGSELAREDSCPTEVASVVRLAIRHMVSCIPSIRETAMSTIRSLSNSSRISVVSLLLAERAVIDEIFEVPSCRIDLKSVPAQIAYLEGLTFICEERQPIFSFGDSPEVVNFLLRIAALLGMEESAAGGEDDFLLLQRRQPKGVPTILRWETVHLTSNLRLAALKALYTIYKFVSDRTQQMLANLLLNNVVGAHEGLQKEAFACLKHLIESRMVSTEILRSADQRLSRLYGSVRKWSLKEVRQVNYLIQLCRSHMPVAVQQLIVEYLKKFTVDMESNLTLVASEHTASDDRKVLDGVIEIFCHLSSVDGSTVDALAELVLEMETKIEKCTVNPLRQSFLSFAEKFSSQVVEWFLIKNGLKSPSVICLYRWLLKQRDASCFRSEISKQSNVLLQLMSSANLLKSQLPKDREMAILEIEAAVIYSFWKLSKTNVAWLLEHPIILEEVRKMWNSPGFSARYGNELAYFSFWKVPKWMVKVMLVYFRADPSNVNLLMELLSCLNSKFLCNFEFFRHYLREELANTGSVEWKRSLFFRFLHSWSPNTPKMNTLLTLLREVILPSFLVSFEKGEAEQLIQGPSEAAGGPDSNIVYVFAKSFLENYGEQKRLDHLQLALFQLSIMFVKYVPCHIFDPSKRNGEGKNSPNLLRPFLMFAWNYMEETPPKDPLLRCHGQVLIAYIVWKFNVKTFVIQQMLPHLVSSFSKEPRPINSQVLSITLRAILRQEEEGRKQLLDSFKELLVANHSEFNCFPETFMLFLRFPIFCFTLRNELMPFLVLTVSTVLHSACLDAFDTKKAAFEAVNMVMKWEIARRKLLSCNDGTATSKELRDFDKEHLNSLVYALLHQWTMLQQRMQVLSKASGSPHSVIADLERLSMQCTSVIKRMLSEEFFGNTVDLNLHAWLLDVLLSSKNANNSDEDAISAHLDLLAIVFGFLPCERVVPTLRTVVDGIAACLHSTHPKAVCSTVKVLTKLHCVFALAGQDFSTVLSETFCSLKTELVSVLSHEIATLSNPRIINRFISLLKNVSSTGSSLTITFAEPLVNAMEQLARLNANQTTPEGKRRSELLMWCLDITKSMVQSLSLKLQKKLVQNVLTVLVENMENFRVLGTIILLVDHWIQVTSGSVGKGELTLDFQIFLLKLVNCVDQKIPFDSEVRKVHYSLVERIKRYLPGLMVELNDKVMGAILAGLASQDEELRSNLFAIYNRELPKTAFERLFHLLTYIIWEPLQPYNWIKQCVELMLGCVELDQPLCLVISSPSSSNAAVDWSTSSIPAKNFLPHLFYLNHGSDAVAYSMWMDCFKSLWSSFSVQQKEGISRALNYFLLNGSHSASRDSGKHVIKTLVDALRGLEPPVAIDPSTYRYVGKAQNAWHTCALLLEEMTPYCGPSPMQAVVPFSRVEQLEILDAFSNLLSTLGETDLSTAVWMRKSSDEALRQGMLWDQHGQFEKSREHYLNTIKLREQSDASNGKEPGRWVFDHHEMVEHFYCACEQLGKWKDVHTLSVRPPEDPMHALESSWRIDNLENVQSHFETIENNCPKEWMLKSALYRGYLSFRTSEQQDGKSIEENVQTCTSLLIKEWRYLPSIFGPGHLKMLRLGQLALELSEASEYHVQLLRLTSGYQTSTVDLKNLQRLWGSPLRNETNILCDDSIHVSSVLTWRIRYLSILESLTSPSDLRSTQRISDMKAKALLVAAKAARKLNMLSFADDCLGNFRVLHYATPKDVGTWIKECALMQMAKAKGLRSVNEMAYPLLQATLMINEAEHDFIPAESNAELFSAQGVMYSMLRQLPQLFELLCARRFFIVANLIGHVAEEFPESVLCHLQIYRSSASGEADEEVVAALEKIHKHVAVTYPVLSSAFADFSKRLICEVANEDSMERLLRQVYDLVECIYDAAFLHQNDSLESEMTNVFSILSSVRQTLATSADNFPESWAQAACDLETVLASAGNVSSIIHAAVVLKNAITTHWQRRNRSIPLIDRSAQLSLFTVGVAELDIPHMWISPTKSAFRPKIARVLPGFDIITYGNVVCKRIHISGTDGKVYSYMLIENESLKNVQSKCRLSQCFHGFNKLLRQDQDSVSRNLQFELPDAIPLGPHHTLILCNTQTKSILSLFAEAFQRGNHSLDDLVVGYYEGMENWERTNKLYHAALRKAYKSVQESLVVKNAFKEQMMLRFPVATDYFSFRKQVCYDVGLLNFAQYFLFLSPFYLEHLMISMSSGFVSTFHQLFDFNQAGEMNQNRPIPFRLTPCISEFLAIGIQGYSLPAMVAGARVLQSHSCVEWIRLFLQSEHTLKLPNISEEYRQQLIGKNLKAIEARLHELANVETGDSRAMTLIGSAQAVDNLCRMNPSWFPWL
ncbi:T complex protein 1 subunit zeta [Trichuris trichiura]|uniref:T complex protein 1 subunit zeta n=1 Tax=Trichuris trichiura TaxID=36087 RepID=A0A077Z435_TRITR|nr:T complex protein 1 subunit zeta [Trichuris trichiura]